MRPLSVLGVYAHPADMVTETGGTLALHVNRGDKVQVLILTHGGRIHPNIYVEERRKGTAHQVQQLVEAARDEVIEIKRRELERAAEILGIANVTCFNYEDTMIGLQAEVVRQVSDAIVQARPDVVITHHPGYGGAALADAHELTGAIALAACRLAATRVQNMDDTDPIFVRQIFFIAVDGVHTRLYDSPSASCDVYVDITRVVELKVRAMDQFVSQGYEGAFARKVAEALNGYMGMMGGRCSYAEAYCRAWPETYDALPLSNQALERDHLTLHRQLAAPQVRSIPLEPSPTAAYRQHLK